MTLNDPNTAMAFRDVVRRMVSDQITSERPSALYGTVLSVAPSGPEFRVAASGLPVDPSGYPTESSGNPRQLVYATVRLDNGEEISARCHDNAPVARDATWYDPDNPSGVEGDVLIFQNVYRYAQLATVKDDFGNDITRIQPDLTKFMPNEPFVPPRVQVYGKAGKYYVDGIMRGMPRLEGGVLSNSFVVGRRLAADLNNEIQTYSSEMVHNQQGWLCNTAFDFRTGFEIELTYGNCYQKYIIPAGLMYTAPWDSWMIVPPVYETAAPLTVGLPSDVLLNTLLIHIQGGSIVNFFIANRSMAGFSLAADNYLGGYAVIRSLKGALTAIAGVPLPTGYDLTGTRTLGYTDSYTAERNVLAYSRPAGTPHLQAELGALKRAMTGGGKVTVSTDTLGVRRIKWTSRFVLMAAKSVYTPSGYYDITMPPVGTLIPAVGSNAGDGVDPTAHDVTVDGVSIQGWGGLYYALPYGSNNATVPGNFVWLQYTGYFSVPDNWVLVFQTNIDGTGADGKLGTGREISQWRNCTLSQGFTQHTSYPAQYKIENGSIRLRGAIINTSGVNKTGVTLTGFLPDTAAPSQSYVAPFLLLTSAGVQKSTSRNDIGASGDLTIRQSVDDNEQVFFDGHVIPFG